MLQSILGWRGLGRGQRGHYDREGFWLEKMIRLSRMEEVGDSEKEFLRA
jgi:hypothetical protein